MTRFGDPRPAVPEDIPALRDLALRSKAHWGYDAAFMAACDAELTLGPGEIGGTGIAVIDGLDGPAGMVQVSAGRDGADPLKLFVEPAAMGAGIGRRLFSRAAGWARRRGARRMVIESDPGAVPFYERMGAMRHGSAPSGSIPGRVLPVLILDLGRG